MARVLNRDYRDDRPGKDSLESNPRRQSTINQKKQSIMKAYYASIITAACFQPVLAQIVVEETVIPTPSGDIVIEEVRPITPPPLRPDPAIARQHLFEEQMVLDRRVLVVRTK